MKKQYFLLVFTGLFLLFSNPSSGQLIGGHAYLQGTFLEIGLCPNGAFGACPVPPAGYHQFCGSCFPVNGLAEVYDYGHDGWGTGLPPFMGDYTLPGSPFEGWEIQMNGGRGQAYQNCTGTYQFDPFGGPTMTGTAALTSYTSAGGRFIANWAGDFNYLGSTLNITQETRVDASASWVVVTTKMHNPGATAIPGVYYWRSCDPDNDQQYTGGGFTTNNMINFQNDPRHRVAVTATGTSSTLPTLTLGTRDCRAVAVIYNSWGLSVAQDLAQVWNQTYGAGGSAFYALGANHNGDIGIGLVYNVGTIPAGGDAVVSYAYIFNGLVGIDEAFPDPVLEINHVAVTAYPDTFDACTLPVGMDTVRAGILYGDDKSWSMGGWTWSPATALASTTGISVLIDLNAIQGYQTYTVTGVDSNYGMYSCHNAQFVFTIHSCHKTLNNSPCEGDTLKFKHIGDSTGGSTYYWYSHTHSFTSTKQNPFKYPATLADTGWYYGVKTIGPFHDTDSTYVTIHPKPILNIAHNSPLCDNALATFTFSVTPMSPGETFYWEGPGGYTATGQFPTRSGITYAEAGTYTVVGTTAFGCKDTNTTLTWLIPPPAAPVITGVLQYCQGDAFVPLSIALAAGATAIWYPSATGGTGSTTPSVINTSFPGYQTVWASQKVGSCEGPRGSLTVRVVTTPPVPVVTGPMEYCQYIGPFVPLTVTTSTATGIAYWYTSATGGSPTLTQPPADLSVAGPHYYWVSARDSGCEGPRLPVTITVHPKPAPPVVTIQHYCQYFAPAPPLAATPLAGHFLTWFGPGIAPTGVLIAPVPPTNVAGIDTYYVNQTSPYGCVSDKAMDPLLIIHKPEPPLTVDTSYCQFSPASALTAIGEPFAQLNWYLGGILLPGGAPVPPTHIAGKTTWYVSQTVSGCEGDSAALTVTTLFKPVVDVTPDNPWVCQFDSILLSYKGPAMVQAAYNWMLPDGASFGLIANGVKSVRTDSSVMIRFDSSNLINYVYLEASDYNGRCSTIDTVRVKVVPEPLAQSFTKADVCVGDTVSLALSSKSPDAAAFVWKVDHIAMENSNALRIISHDSRSGGPMMISWIDSGKHVIQLNPFTIEGCTSKPVFDSINVHPAPDASIKVVSGKGACLEDSVLFEANTINYKNSYAWAPEHFFSNVNKPTAWGRVEQNKSVILLTVTDPFGCKGTNSYEMDVASCCSVNFPNAFTPNGDSRNDVFHPIFEGFHRFHTFRIANRWGQTIFESANSNPSWDGNYNGVPQDMGVYFYYLKYDCGGDVLESRGDVTLIR